MAQNSTTAADESTEMYAKLLDWYDALSPEKRAELKLPKEDHEDWFSATMEAMILATAGSDGEEHTGKGKRAPVHYTILLFEKGKDGVVKCSVAGSGFGSVGAPATDPKKYSPIQKLEGRIAVQVIRLQRSGVQAETMRVPTKSLPALFGVSVPVPEKAPAPEAQASEQAPTDAASA